MQHRKTWLNQRGIFSKTIFLKIGWPLVSRYWRSINTIFAPKQNTMQFMRIACCAIFSCILTISSALGQGPQPNREKPERQDRLVVDFTYERFINRPDYVDFKWYNHGINAALFWDIPLRTSPFSAAVGIGISNQGYFSSSQILRDSNVVGENYSDWFKVNDIDGEGVKRTKVTSTYAELPIEIRWRSQPNERGHRWKIMLGVKPGILLDVHDKIRLNNGDKYKNFNFSDHSEYRVNGTLRIAYGKVGLFAGYTVTPWFEEDKGPEMNQLSIGISLLPF